MLRVDRSASGERDGGQPRAQRRRGARAPAATPFTRDPARGSSSRQGHSSASLAEAFAPWSAGGPGFIPTGRKRSRAAAMLGRPPAAAPATILIVHWNQIFGLHCGGAPQRKQRTAEALRLSPEEFIEKWRNVEASESAASQTHFNDLCRLLDVKSPIEVDSRGVDYTFEKHVTKPDGRSGFADVWMREHFAWEYKGDKRNLVEAYSQLKDYADALENPPMRGMSQGIGLALSRP
jgi:hypothetical protein